MDTTFRFTSELESMIFGDEQESTSGPELQKLFDSQDDGVGSPHPVEVFLQKAQLAPPAVPLTAFEQRLQSAREDFRSRILEEPLEDK